MASYPIRIIGLGCLLVFVHNIYTGSTVATNNAKEQLKSSPSPPARHRRKKRASEKHKQVTPQRVVLGTFVFGETAANLRRLSMFLETAATSGFDYVILGHPVPSYPLPPNVRHFSITWEQLVDRVLDKVFQGGQSLDPQKVNEVRIGSPYKVCDYKPLLGFLLPEVVAGYQWWGYVDNDALVGNLTKFLPPSMLGDYDLVTSCTSCFSSGPFMIYRNIPAVNELFLKASQYQTLESIFFSANYIGFDEWGKPGSSDTFPHPENQASMSRIISDHAAGLGLRGYKMKPGVVWDYAECQNYNRKDHGPLSERCAECVYDGGNLTLSRTQMGVFLCHYEGSKNALERSLEDETKWKQLITGRKFRVTWEGGFDFVTDEPYPSRLKLRKMRKATQKRM